MSKIYKLKIIIIIRKNVSGAEWAIILFYCCCIIS